MPRTETLTLPVNEFDLVAERDLARLHDGVAGVAREISQTFPAWLNCDVANRAFAARMRGWAKSLAKYADLCDTLPEDTSVEPVEPVEPAAVADKRRLAHEAESHLAELLDARIVGSAYTAEVLDAKIAAAEADLAQARRVLAEATDTPDAGAGQ